MTIKILDIPEILLSQRIVSTSHAANATFVYVVRWMEGAEFDMAKSAVKVHRARLRKIGLDIAKPFSGEVVSNISKKFLNAEQGSCNSPAC